MTPDDELDDPFKPEYRGTSSAPLVIAVGLLILTVLLLVIR